MSPTSIDNSLALFGSSQYCSSSIKLEQLYWPLVQSKWETLVTFEARAGVFDYNSGIFDSDLQVVFLLEIGFETVKKAFGAIAVSTRLSCQDGLRHNPPGYDRLGHLSHRILCTFAPH